MAERDKPWLLQPSTRWKHFRQVPLEHLWLLMVAVFFTFSVIGFYVDLSLTSGQMPFAVAATIALISGLNAGLWIIVLARSSRLFLFVLIAAQFFTPAINTAVANWVVHTFNPPPVSSQTGIQFAATGILCAVIASYIFFVSYIRIQGMETFRIRNELALAHGIQKTLVPPISLRSARFDVYGSSYPSDKVGGDLVDALLLPNGDMIAYLADIAGHGLQAGILMGMLKTAVRTALLDAGAREPHRTLPLLLERLNTVLPAVKEPQMYATFTGFRLGEDGSVFYALAASPPIIHWHAGAEASTQIGDPQLPLGLLPVSSFDGEALQPAPGDLLVVATDGILETSNKTGDDYGAEQLMQVIEANSADPLPQLAQKILDSARAFGSQFDDQTILLVRCL